MPTLCEIAVYRDGRGPAQDETMVLEGVAEAVRRMSDVRSEYPEAIVRFQAPSDTPDRELKELCRRAAAAGLTLERTFP